MGIHKNINFMINYAIEKAKNHNMNYNIIIMNTNDDGKFDEEHSTYECVTDSFFEKPRPFVKLLYKTDLLLNISHFNNKIKEFQLNIEKLTKKYGFINHLHILKLSLLFHNEIEIKNVYTIEIVDKTENKKIFYVDGFNNMLIPKL